MATTKQKTAAAKARAAKRRYAQNGKGLSGIGLGNLKTLNKNEAVGMVKDSGAVILGFAAGKIGGALIKKAVIKEGDENGIKAWIPTLVQLGGGFIVSATGKGNQFVKVMGNGMMASGAIEALEAGTKKTIAELVGIEKPNTTDETVDGLGRNFNEVESIDFNPNLPELDGVTEERYLDDTDFDTSEFPERKSPEFNGIREEIDDDLNEDAHRAIETDDYEEDDDIMLL